MSRHQREQRQRARAFRRSSSDSFPGTIAFPPGDPVPCSVDISTAERQTVDGGFTRIRSAAVMIAKSDLPTLPDLETRPEVSITQGALPAETFRVFESHDKSEDHWFLRCGQWQ